VHLDHPHVRPGTATPNAGYGYQTWIIPGERRMFLLWGAYGAADLRRSSEEARHGEHRRAQAGLRSLSATGDERALVGAGTSVWQLNAGGRSHYVNGREGARLAKDPMTNARLWHPWLRINRVLRVMLQTRWSAEAWAKVRAEFKGALALKSQLRSAGWFIN
jgi:hypothetical protein